MAQLPEAVQRQIDEAEKLEAGLSQAPAGDSADSAQAPEQADSQQAPPQEEPQTDPKDERIAELEKELNSVRIEHGRVRSLTQQLRSAQEQIERMEGEMETLRTQQQAPQQQQVSNAKREELVESYGEDLVTYMEEIAGSQAAKLQSEIERLKGETGEVKKSQAHSRQERFWADLNAVHSDWQQVQQTPEGQEFLLSRVPYDMQGRTFDDLLQAAAQSFNAQAAIDVFNGMKAHVSANKKATPQDRAKAQVVPGKGPGGAPPTQNAKPTISQAEVHRASLEYAKDQSLDIPRKYGAKTIDEWDVMVNEAALEGRLK